MKKFIEFMTLISLSFSPSLLKAQNISDIIGRGEAISEAKKIVANLGLNCATPDNWSVFVNEMYKLLAGITRVASESTLMLALKKDYPTMCHVLTQPQINAYREGQKTNNSSSCVSRVFGTCVLRKHVKTIRPTPSYYVPKYFIEVTEKGNDPHPAFAEDNKLYTLNRNISASLESLIDAKGAIKLTSMVMGSGQVLNAFGGKTGTQDWSQLTKNALLTPFQKMRISANKDATNTTYQAAIWPVALSELIASRFTVCGPILKDKGEHPGGYTWSAKGIPMTCPVSMSQDATAYWDTGMIDYLDPEALTAAAAGSNPLTCGIAEGMTKLANMSGGKAGPLGEQGSINSSLSKLSNKMSKSLKLCSFPVLGNAEAIAKKALSATSMDKWKQSKCTIWGSLAPRMSSSVYSNDYSYANTALKWKLFSHEMFGTPRGQQERWSIALPWEGRGSSTFGGGKYGGIEKIHQNVSGKFGSFLKEKGINLPGGKTTSRSEALLPPGSPLLIDTSYTKKHFSDQVNQLANEAGYLATMAASGNSAAAWLGAETARAKSGRFYGRNPTRGGRRIYTIWEKISCTGKSMIVKTKVGPAPEITKYQSCRDAIRFEVYKFVQLKLLRRICNALGQEEGKPWK